MKVNTLLLVILGFFGFLQAQDVNSCPKPIVRKRTIIHSRTSIQNGAQLLKKLTVESARNCYVACCNTNNCNVAVMHYKQEVTAEGDEEMKKFCFLFDCQTPSVCTYEDHNRYAIIEVTKPKLEEKVTVSAATTATTTSSTTTTTTSSSSTTSKTTLAAKAATSKSFAREKCPPGAPVAMCAGNPCEEKHCLADRSAVCKPSFCGGCFAKFYDAAGNEVKCDQKTKSTVNNDLEDIQVAEVQYGETPTDSLPGPSKKHKSEEKDPYFNSERRDWVDGRNPGDLINATNEEHKSKKPVVDDIPNEKKVIIVNNSLMSVPLFIALIISIVLIIGLIYRFKCARRGKPKKLPVDDGDYLINGMYL